MFDYDDDLPQVKPSLKQEWVSGRGMVRSALSVGLVVGAAVGTLTVIAVASAERMKR